MADTFVITYRRSPRVTFISRQVTSKMRVMVTLGRVEIDFEAKSNKNGIVEWNRGEEVCPVQQILLKGISTPYDSLQLKAFFLR